jgi:hypothetical protein
MDAREQSPALGAVRAAEAVLEALPDEQGFGWKLWRVQGGIVVGAVGQDARALGVWVEAFDEMMRMGPEWVEEQARGMRLQLRLARGR